MHFSQISQRYRFCHPFGEGEADAMHMHMRHARHEERMKKKSFVVSISSVGVLLVQIRGRNEDWEDREDGKMHFDVS